MALRSLSLLAASLSLLPGYGHGQSLTSFHNPILPGFHPDPSCIFVGEEETFYCASSSFNAFPGIPIHASKDLRRWRLIGHALNRPSQLPDLAASAGSTSGIWAPALRRHNGTFYIATTLVHDRKTPEDPTRWDNIIFSTTDLWNESRWTDAVHFQFQGYDPSLHWDDDGNSYIVASHAYRVEPGIRLNRVNLETGEVLGNWTNLWNGTGGLAPEGPHIYRKDGYYYLMIAEGGTGLGHMQTIARSSSLYGPYDPNPANPILTNANTSAYFQTVGHADIFQDATGNWWGVALSTRSGPEYITYPMGRETVLTNVTWENGSWPIFNNPVKGSIEGWKLPIALEDLPGNGPLVDDDDNNIQFQAGSTIPPHFTFWRPPIEDSFVISPKGRPGSLQLNPSNLNLTGLDGNSPGPGGQTFVGRRQTHTLFTYSIDFDYEPTSLDEEAGITLFLTQNHHARFGIAMLPTSSESNSTLAPHFLFHAISYIRVPPDFAVPVPQPWLHKPLTLQLKTENMTHYSFAAGPADGEEPLRIFGYVPGDIVSWGFTGTLVGVYATTNGGNGTTPAYVTNWNYRGWGQVRDNQNGTYHL